MSEQVTISVYRRLDNRMHGLPDDSPEAWNLHRERAAGLHAAFDQDPIGWQVLDWGDTDDETQTHELVELVVAVGQFVAGAAAQVPVTPVVGWIGGVLSAALTDSAVTGLKVLVARLRGQQEQGKLLDFSIAKDGQMLLRVDPDSSAVPNTVTARLPDGRHVTVSWAVTAGELPK
jgi:hypothetical protein